MLFRRSCTYNVEQSTRHYAKSSVTLCNLGVGATFGETILHDLPRDSTVVTKTTCELLRVEQQDFRLIWEVSS
ncbi:GL10974 [Drosophila persimilis]|uniref:GL10974 n=1 Tax=Drosophila persimilis TaxID=7234 RepID=B4GC93_DROPE|nr:GL10974 [Drosophila persimilis]